MKAGRTGEPFRDARRGPGPGRVLGRIGALEVRLAGDPAEVAAAQELRQHVFSRELGAGGKWRDRLSERDFDLYDPVCDHLVVLDTGLPGPERGRVVGTYRLLRQELAEKHDGFYSEKEFDLASLVARHPHRRFLELGRSCVLQAYRSKRTLELLWQGIWAYCQLHGIDVMVGCASFGGIIPARHAEPLSLLAHHFRAPGEWDVRALDARRNPIDLMPAEAVDARRALALMPPLIKGYLRLGAKIGEDCVVDHDFGTIDVFVVLPREAISLRYIQHYGTEATRFAA